VMPLERACGQSLPPLRHDVVINEIHYDPDVRTELVEFVELYNTGPNDVNLVGWRLCDGLRYTFSPEAVLPARGYVIAAQDWDSVVLKWSLLMIPVNDHEKAYGPFEGRLGNEGQVVTLCDPYDRVVDRVKYQLGFPWPTVGDPVPRDEDGTGHSIQLMNPALDNDLGASWRSASPTPAAKNAAVYSENTPPQMRQVDHNPQPPLRGEVVTITVKVTDSDGVKRVTLLYQLVNPGTYIPLTLPNQGSVFPNETKSNPDYEAAANWSSLPMHDDGLNGDQTAGDDVYTVQMPASLQSHRRLIRYRITAEDNGGRSVRVPYADDPQPNFAYFVYDGVPAWSGAIQPSSSDPARAKVVVYDANVLGSLPIYHLIARETDVTNCQYNGSYDNTEYYFSGTLVYDGQVYDNVHYRVRGQYSTTQTGKNKWKFDFNRGHYFQARDDYGTPYNEKWDKMNVGTGCCPWWASVHPAPSRNYWDAGTQGMVINEVLGFRLYNITGVPSCHTNYFQFRVIASAAEADPSNQYKGDFWGLYLTIEQPDGAFLDEHGLPDGNVYRMDGGANKTHQGLTQAAGSSDVSGFISIYSASPSKDWWAQNVNLANYYSSRAVGVAINDSDRRPEANCIFYHNSQTSQWWVLPWDLDLTFEWSTHYTDWEHLRYALTYPDYSIASKNRARELLDLLFNGDQAWQLVDEIAGLISTPYDGRTFVEANRALWDYHPRTVKKGQFYENNEFLKIKDWTGLVGYYKTFLSATGVSSSGSYGVNALVTEAADLAIPNTPKVSYVGPSDYPINALEFQTTSFSAPQGGGGFAAMQWRIAEVESFSQINAAAAEVPSGTVLVDAQQKWRYFKGKSAPSTDPAAWRQIGFNDDPAQGAWLEGIASIGYGNQSFIGTRLSDMRTSYSTIYLRKTFTVADLEAIDSLNLEVQYDDGFVAWINGVLVALDNVSGPDLAYNATASKSKEVSDLTAIPVANPKEVLKAGQNVLAVQVLNSSLSSNDCYFDARLVVKPVGSEEPEGEEQARPVVRGRPGLYEIQAAWESGEISLFNSQIQIPAGVVEAGRTYRVRCRMKDTTGRWSHWSDPIQFVAGAALPDRPVLPLRITEIMYNPPASLSEDGWDLDEFEYIELMNVGTTPIDLSGVRIVEGIAFDFAGSAVTQLGPGQYVLVVENRVAFECRYGTAVASRIAGEYSGKLSNGGEKVKVVDLQTGVVAEFEYDDTWYASTDGEGRSLVLVNPATVQPDQMGQKASWRASTRWGGSPGAADTQ